MKVQHFYGLQCKNSWVQVEVDVRVYVHPKKLIVKISWKGWILRDFIGMFKIIVKKGRNFKGLDTQ